MVGQIFIETLGCRTNQYESSCILDDFLKAGWTQASTIYNADMVIINTCSVTNRTDYKSRYLISKAKDIKRKNHTVVIVVTGCYSQTKSEEILADGCVDFIVDNNDKHNIYKYLQSNLTPKEIAFSTSNSFTDFMEMTTTSMSDKSRAILKIQDGCDCDCAYCIVPALRGKSRSRSVESIKQQVLLLLDHGHTEIVLSGINLGLYHSTENLSTLLYTLAKYDKLKQIRLSSIEPHLSTDDPLNAVKEIDKICPHFHLPLQTGCDTLLKIHNRKYTTRQFRDLTEKLNKIKPDCAIGFDIIAGLPNETDELFAETLQFLESIDFAYLHTFVYSRRKNTKAATMPQVNGTIAKQRSKILINLFETKKEKYINKLIQKKIPLYAIGETYDKKNKTYSGTSDRYVKVYTKKQIDNDTPLIPTKPINDGIFCETHK